MQRTINVLVGLFVLLGLLALLFLALKVSNLTSMAGGPTYSVVAYFDDIGGLKPRAAVRGAGVVVGRVSSIDFDDQRYQARVLLEIDSGVEFPKDTSAQILTSGLLGEKYIGLSPGADPQPLKNNDRITMTQSAVVLENIISQFLFNRDDGESKSGGLK
ncbi:MAG: outer membrane lipid asymmetry maintenance protein MlaD [Burkholderiaceae bacterium]|jgi:phospholipid/cholesterol/gamma-HCH transport system substrate-binding protein|nr:outer membrane lipid asymmetry maintenance protein MlaD [Burkholderiaceae bacterium]MDP4669030.1 outer membrane lipid asymmetry maintenance protein MlaD [Burkholderiaceae bacterium]MDP4800411.1 outer membrane lipid asymmetry maintenance protein MlaD [Burkholderiaceae bacterium]